MGEQACQWALTRKRTLGALVREAGGLLQRAQRGVSLQALGESSSSLGTEFVETQTASMGAEAGAEACQWALTRKRTLGGGALEIGDLRLVEDGSERGGALGSDAIKLETASVRGRI